MKHIYTLTFSALLFTGCSTHNPFSSIEDIYTNTTVVKPTSGNYKTSASTSTAPIVKETVTETVETTEKKSVQVSYTGRIINTSFDDEVKLYIYTFLPNNSQEHTVFFYDQKLNFPTSTVLDVNILDNYLMRASKHVNKSSQSIVEKKKYIKTKRKNSNIRESIEEKINTL